MITRIKSSSVVQGLPKYRSMLAGNDAYVPPSFDSIASANGTGSSTTITFSSIPSTYKHLQIRYSMTGVTDGSLMIMRFNGDSGSNYGRHYLYADVTSGVSAGGSASTTSIFAQSGGADATQPTVGIIDIHDYANTTRYKTSRSIAGKDMNGGAGWLELDSGVWMNTSAITSISIIQASFNYSTSSTFALYGIRG